MIRLGAEKQRNTTRLDRVRFLNLFCKLSSINPKCVEFEKFYECFSNAVVLIRAKLSHIFVNTATDRVRDQQNY